MLMSKNLAADFNGLQFDRAVSHSEVQRHQELARAASVISMLGGMGLIASGFILGEFHHTGAAAFVAVPSIEAIALSALYRPKATEGDL